MFHYNVTVNVKRLCKVCSIHMKDDHPLTRNPSAEPSGGTACACMERYFGWLKSASWHWLYHWKEASVHSHCMHYCLWEEGHTSMGSPSASGSQPASSNLSTKHLLAQLVSSYYILNPSNFNLFFWLFRFLVYRIPNHWLTNLDTGLTRCSEAT